MVCQIVLNRMVQRISSYFELYWLQTGAVRLFELEHRRRKRKKEEEREERKEREDNTVEGPSVAYQGRQRTTNAFVALFRTVGYLIERDREKENKDIKRRRSR